MFGSLSTVAFANNNSAANQDNRNQNMSDNFPVPALFNKTALEFEMEEYNARREKHGYGYRHSYGLNENNASVTYHPAVVKTRNQNGANLYSYEYFYDRNATNYPEVGPMVQIFKQWNPTLNDYGKTARYMVVPDENNNIEYYYQDKFDNGHWINSYRFKGTYDAAGHELSGTKEYWENNTWVARMHWDSEYDPDGNITSQKYKTFIRDSEDWADGVRYNWEYENGFLTKYTYWSKTDAGYVKTMERFYINDKDGRVITMTQQQLGKNIARDVYTYNENGLMMSYTTERWDEQGSFWYGQQRIECTYDESGRITSETSFTSSAKLPVDETIWENVSKKSYTYDDNTEVVTSYNFNSEDGNWVSYSRISTTYNSRGDKTFYQTETFNAEKDIWETRAESVWVYDGKNNLSSFKGENIFGETRFVASAYSYTYDENDNAVSAFYEKLGNRESLSLPYNNMADLWTGNFDFVSTAAEAEYVNVATDYVVPTDIHFNLEKMVMRINETARVEVEVLPANATNKFVHWSVDDANIAFIDVDGRVTALAEGETTIKATTIEGLHVAELPLYVTSNGGSGIDNIDADGNTNPVYYNLQGVEISNPVAGTVCIRRCGSKAEKIIY